MERLQFPYIGSETAWTRGVRRWSGSLRLAAALLAASVPAVALAPAALAQGPEKSGSEMVKRLRFEYKCVFDIPEWKGKAEDVFLQRLRDQHAALAASSPSDLPRLEELMAEALWRRARDFRDRKDLDTASRLSGEILGLKTDIGDIPGYKEQAEELIGAYNLGKGKELHAAGDLARARESLRPCLGLRNESTVKEAVGILVDIVKRTQDLDAATKSGDLSTEANVITAILGEIDSLLADVKVVTAAKTLPSIEALRARSAALDKDTQSIDIGTLACGNALSRVKFPSAALDAAKASITFEPVGGDGTAWPPGGSRAGIPRSLRLMRGTYDVRVRVPGVAWPVATWIRVALKETKQSLQVPDRIPEGMVYIGPWAGGGGFFIDRTEVSVGQVKAVAGGSEALAECLKESNKEDEAPAWILSEAAARDYEKASGKSIPTRDQWLQAAFGPYAAGEWPYPWGKTAPVVGTHFFMDPNASGPKPVTALEAGASPYGPINMAGNVSEWVVLNGGLWTLGGNYLVPGSTLTGEDGKSWLREPAPGPLVYAAMSGPEQNAIAKHKVEGDFYTLGLRMVIPVGR